ncbi:MAG: hypothetical protein SangKO_075350 [Sandaracinaceae bacterium]
MSKIEWTDRTLNCFVGCRRVSQGCRHCYAEGQVHRSTGSSRPSTAA